MLPLQTDDFRAPQPVAIGQQDKRIIPRRPPALLGRGEQSPALIRLKIPPLSLATIYISTHACFYLIFARACIEDRFGSISSIA